MVEAPDPLQTFTDILVDHGPLTEDDLVTRLGAAGIADPEGAFDELTDGIDSAAGQLTDGRWVWLPKLLTGRVFTHRLSHDEVAHDVLTVTPDLDPISILCQSEPYAQFADGSPAQVVLPMFDVETLDERGIPLDAVDELGALLLAPGSLASTGVGAGDLIGLRLTPAGLAIERVTNVGDDAVAPELAALLGADEPEFFDAVVWTVCADDPALFTQPLAPLSEIVDAVGLQRTSDQLAAPGFDFDRWYFEHACARLAGRYELDPHEAIALHTLLEICDQTASETGDANSSDVESVSSIDDDELIAEFGATLADPALAQILAAEALARSGAGALDQFAEALEPKVPRSARVAYRWLQAVAQERSGRVGEAERTLLAAEAIDTDWAPVLFDLARFAGDRGDAERGLSLLRRAGAGPDDPMVTLLEQHRVTPRSDLGRNDVCWCGSGRKYKKCHLGREQLPLAERANWLYTKGAQHIVLTGWEEVLEEVAFERERHLDEDLDGGASDPLCVDAVLFEGGAFADFIETRGFLLPADERALAEQWLLVDRSVFEVEEVRRGQGITVRDVRTGDRLEVRERRASGVLKPGQLICTRILPAGDSMQFFGGIEPVALHERDALIALLDAEPDPVRLVAQLSRRFVPPTLVNTEGDPLVMCRAVVRVGDATGIHPALDATYERLDGEEPPRWLEHTTAQGMRRVRAVFVLEDDVLRVETNSGARMDAALATLIRIDPTAIVLEDTREPLDDVGDIATLAAQSPGGGATLDPNDPEVAAALDTIIREYEVHWLDESIPALDGHTPREAADDPTRRGDLIKLLATFPTGDAALGGMDADRLRAALGL